MRAFIAAVGAGLAGLAVAANQPAVASVINGPPDTNVDWAQEFCITDCTSTLTSSPITQIDIVMATPGVTFTGISALYTDIGETTLASNAATVLGATESVINFSPADTVDEFLSLNFSPEHKHPVHLLLGAIRRVAIYHNGQLCHFKRYGFLGRFELDHNPDDSGSERGSPAYGGTTFRHRSGPASFYGLLAQTTDEIG